jgi:glutamate synthase (NADPH/NADH) small chain
MILRTSSSHEEGCERQWAIQTQAFLGNEQNEVSALELVEVEWKKGENGRYGLEKKEGSEKRIPCDLAFLAIGFTGPRQKGLLAQLNLELDERGNVKTRDYQTSDPKVFAAGDMRRGQSLVVWAISEGREVARAVDEYLGQPLSRLDSKHHSILEV